jgi:hypothetical protein
MVNREPCSRSLQLGPRSGRVANSCRLPTEVGAIELARLRVGESGPVQDLHDLVGDLSLRLWKRGRRAPVQASANVLMKSRPRVSELVGAPVQVADLLEQGLEELLVDGHDPERYSVRRSS